MGEVAAMAERERRPSVAEALEGHVTLDIECFDRMVFTAYIPLLQRGGGVVTFLRDHRGNPIPSPALFAPIGQAFRAAVRRSAEEQHIPLIPFRSRQDKLATVRPHLDAAAAAQREGVVAIGVAQERRSVWMGCADPAALQRICDDTAPADVAALFRRWMDVIPLPLTPPDRAAGYDWQLSMRQIEFSRTLVLDRPAQGRAFMADVAREGLGLGGHSEIGFLFDRHIIRRGKRPTPGTFRTEISVQGVDPRLSVYYRSSRIKEYLKEGRALRIETVCNDPGDPGVRRRLVHLGELREKARALNRRMLAFQRASCATNLATSLFDEVALPDVRAGQRTVALRYGDPRVVALLGALALVLPQLLPFTNADLRATVEKLWERPYRSSQLSYDLRRLRAKGLIRRLDRRHRYVTTDKGTAVALLFTKSYQRFVHPLLAVDAPDVPPTTAPEVRRALRTIDVYVEGRAREVSMAA